MFVLSVIRTSTLFRFLMDKTVLLSASLLSSVRNSDSLFLI